MKSPPAVTTGVGRISELRRISTPDGRESKPGCKMPHLCECRFCSFASLTSEARWKSDLLVRRALALFEERPSERWTVTSLARALSTSRPVLARRFVEAIGVPPLRALTLVRMRRAAELLLATEDGLAAIADAVGYDSEFAFSRAFRRHRGVRPGQFRRDMRRAPVALAA